MNRQQILLLILLFGASACKPQVVQPNIQRPGGNSPQSREPVDPREEELGLPKTDPKDLPKSNPVIKTEDVAGHEGLLIEPNWTDKVDFFEFAVCQDDPPHRCQPTLDAPERFVTTPHLYHKPPTGKVTVSVRPCINAAHSSSSEICGAYGKSPFLVEGRRNDAIVAILDERNRLTEELIQRCSEIRKTLLDYRQQKIGDEKFQAMVQDYLLKTTPEACAAIMGSSQVTQVSSVDIAHDSLISKGAVAVIALGSVAVASLVFAAFSQYKTMALQKSLDLETKMSVSSELVAIEKKGYNPDVRLDGKVVPLDGRVDVNTKLLTPENGIRSVGADNIKVKNSVENWGKLRTGALVIAGIAATAAIFSTAFETNRSGLTNFDPSLATAELDRLWETIKLIRSSLGQLDEALSLQEKAYAAAKPQVGVAANGQTFVPASPSADFSMIFMSDPQLP